MVSQVEGRNEEGGRGGWGLGFQADICTPLPHPVDRTNDSFNIGSIL